VSLLSKQLANFIPSLTDTYTQTDTHTHTHIHTSHHTPHITHITRHTYTHHRGHFARVHKCLDKTTGKQHAVKIFNKHDLVDDSTVKLEMKILSKVGKHPNVIELNDCFEDDDHFYIVMEL